MKFTKQEVICIAKDRGHFIDESRRIYFKECDYTGNCIAPENTSYKLYYWDIFGKRHKYNFWPNTVGFQGLR